MPKKFVTTDAWSSPRNKFGSSLPLEFMEVQVMMAAQKEGFENYRVFCQSIDEVDGAITANLTSVRFKNIPLIERMVESQETVRAIVAASNIALAGGDLIPGFTQHDQKNFPIGVGYLNRIFTEFKDRPESQSLIQHVIDLAAREPAIAFNPEEGLLERTLCEGVNLEEFLRSEGRENENVFYIRSLVRSDDERVLPLLEKLRQRTKAKFLVTPESQKFFDKQIVIDDARLKKYAMPTMCCATSELGPLVDFYRENGSQEGLVLKPGNGGSFGGTGIVVLEPGIAEDEIETKIREAVAEMSGDVGKKYTTQFSMENIVAQKRLNNLSADGVLAAGDIRFSIINGELVGAALRYSDDSSVKILSYELTKSVLHDPATSRDLPFTRDNIEFVKSQSPEEHQPYYDNLLRMHDAVMDVVDWSRADYHFHNGVDMLLGRDSAGNWQFCLTEVNNVIPDCIPETQYLNAAAGESSDKAQICASIVRIVKNNQHITADAPPMSFAPPIPAATFFDPAGVALSASAEVALEGAS